MCGVPFKDVAEVWIRGQHIEPCFLYAKRGEIPLEDRQRSRQCVQWSHYSLSKRSFLFTISCSLPPPSASSPLLVCLLRLTQVFPVQKAGLDMLTPGAVDDIQKIKITSLTKPGCRQDLNYTGRSLLNPATACSSVIARPSAHAEINVFSPNVPRTAPIASL
jgi:hypothetical protein